MAGEADVRLILQIPVPSRVVKIITDTLLSDPGLPRPPHRTASAPAPTPVSLLNFFCS
jgi:hypothetical protein